MSELDTLEKCTPMLETALEDPERELVHYLTEKCFITNQVRDSVLDALSPLDASQKAGALVKGIKNRVKQDPESYHVLMKRFMEGGEQYRPIVTVLEKEYRRQEVQGYCWPMVARI
jgi:hypothetical protein